MWECSEGLNLQLVCGRDGVTGGVITITDATGITMTEA
jgi:hypothetical protein